MVHKLCPFDTHSPGSGPNFPVSVAQLGRFRIIDCAWRWSLWSLWSGHRTPVSCASGKANWTPTTHKLCSVLVVSERLHCLTLVNPPQVALTQTAEVHLLSATMFHSCCTSCTSKLPGGGGIRSFTSLCLPRVGLLSLSESSRFFGSQETRKVCKYFCESVD